MYGSATECVRGTCALIFLVYVNVSTVDSTYRVHKKCADPLLKIDAHPSTPPLARIPYVVPEPEHIKYLLPLTSAQATPAPAPGGMDMPHVPRSEERKESQNGFALAPLPALGSI